ncbi:hypothetical protein Pla108_17450 [Botrimarina colliarenosi]|uniref:Uncharacterized protein n=1 Tax=Botrimarina colliarenosi TaxID=2528001 RepID=A0A5C6AHE5_9BACT|nr:hypothetical protein Pla108_17450 [Botrimarina colliarenosi]
MTVQWTETVESGRQKMSPPLATRARIARVPGNSTQLYQSEKMSKGRPVAEKG